MEYLNTSATQSSELVMNKSSYIQIILGLLLLFPLLLLLRWQSSNGGEAGKEPPLMAETVPYISNSLLCLSNMGAFLDKVRETLETRKSGIAKVYLGFRPVYIVAGAQNVQRLFGSPEVLDGDFIHFILMNAQWGLTQAEMARFRKDKSGRHKKPLPGTEQTPDDQRYWRNHNLLYANFLSEASHSDALAAQFTTRFAERLDGQPVGVWTTVRLLDFLKAHMAECAIATLFGTRLLELNPELVKRYWEYDAVAGRLILGFPHWMQPRAVRVKARLHAMVLRHIDAAWDSFDWAGPDADAAWEPHFGSRLSRESARWLREQGFSDHVAAGHTLATLFGLNGNTVPITAWAMMELIRDPALLRAVRDELRQSGACAPDSDTRSGPTPLIASRVVGLPLLQSLYVEAMRLHVSFSVTREVRKGPVELVPGYRGAETGALVQAVSDMAHLDEAVWGVDGHPASEFWAWRHVKFVDDEPEEQEEDDSERNSPVRTRKMQFAMRGRPSSFFPYGGGYWVCPGRHFAKMEIMLALALMVTKFDFEFVEWTNLDGTKSDRPARDDRNYAGIIAMVPDRDMTFQWKRIC
ncbi:cytochrome P450 [Chaetomium strumarium]|uniref:Cytochrome P450 n=1 Tax=Chaetomium strumarium TaxID=1170767 RepID=A0AAJ0GMH9_9PEZI|nr:cytochrome P450 [Chaetomium strumarium]